jgi:excisionase family DNA binding protein
MTDNMLSYIDAARFLGVKLGTLYALVSQHRVPHVRLGRRLVRFDAADLARWIDERRVPEAKQGTGGASSRASAHRPKS